MAKNDDFGFYGSGLSGYIHYMQGMDEARKGNGGGRPPKNGGCLSSVLLIIAAFVLFYIALSW